jgi:hypothetical protein
MGTGVVSVALQLDRHDGASDALLVATAVMAAALTALRAATLVVDPRRLVREAREPASLTAVAATCVLGIRLTGAGWGWAGGALLVCAAAAWAPLLWTVLRHWRTPARGAGFLVAVSTEALAVLCAAVASTAHAGWLAVAAVPVIACGLGLYGFAATSFDIGELVRGRGDQWVAGGALAIAALAAGADAAAARSTHTAVALREPVGALAVVLWALAMAWLPALVLAELGRPRRRFDARRWSTVFPLGMYAAMSYVVGAEDGRAWMVAFARAWTLVAAAVWLAVAGATVRRAVRLLADIARPGAGGHRPEGGRVRRRAAGPQRG